MIRKIWCLLFHRRKWSRKDPRIMHCFRCGAMWDLGPHYDQRSWDHFRGRGEAHRNIEEIGKPTRRNIVWAQRKTTQQ